jgi:GTP-binding protein EngB required for normal cell division
MSKLPSPELRARKAKLRVVRLVVDVEEDEEAVEVVEQEVAEVAEELTEEVLVAAAKEDKERKLLLRK